MPVMFMLLQKLTFYGKFQKTDLVILDHLRFLGDTYYARNVVPA
jgi:hypothetical protein